MNPYWRICNNVTVVLLSVNFATLNDARIHKGTSMIPAGFMLRIIMPRDKGAVGHPWMTYARSSCCPFIYFQGNRRAFYGRGWQEDMVLVDNFTLNCLRPCSRCINGNIIMYSYIATHQLRYPTLRIHHRGMLFAYEIWGEERGGTEIISLRSKV